MICFTAEIYHARRLQRTYNLRAEANINVINATINMQINTYCRVKKTLWGAWQFTARAGGNLEEKQRSHGNTRQTLIDGVADVPVTGMLIVVFFVLFFPPPTESVELSASVSELIYPATKKNSKLSAGRFSSSALEMINMSAGLFSEMSFLVGSSLKQSSGSKLRMKKKYF